MSRLNQKDTYQNRPHENWFRRVYFKLWRQHRNSSVAVKMIKKGVEIEKYPKEFIEYLPDVDK